MLEWKLIEDNVIKLEEIVIRSLYPTNLIVQVLPIQWLTTLLSISNLSK